METTVLKLHDLNYMHEFKLLTQDVSWEDREENYIIEWGYKLLFKKDIWNDFILLYSRRADHKEEKNNLAPREFIW